MVAGIRNKHLLLGREIRAGHMHGGLAAPLPGHGRPHRRRRIHRMHREGVQNSAQEMPTCSSQKRKRSKGEKREWQGTETEGKPETEEKPTKKMFGKEEMVRGCVSQRVRNIPSV